MKAIKQTSNYGQFDYSIIAEIGEDVNAETTKLCLGGLADAGFRAAGSSVDKALVAYGDGETVDKDGNYVPLATGTKRADIPYTQARAFVVQKAAQAALDKLTTDKGYPTMIFEVTGKHEYGETETASKEAIALFDALAKLIGGEDKAVAKLEAKTKEEAIAVCKSRLQDEKKKAQTAALAALSGV